MKSGNATCICAPTFHGKRCETCKYARNRMRFVIVTKNYPSFSILFYENQASLFQLYAKDSVKMVELVKSKATQLSVAVHLVIMGGDVQNVS